MIGTVGSLCEMGEATRSVSGRSQWLDRVCPTAPVFKEKARQTSPLRNGFHDVQCNPGAFGNREEPCATAADRERREDGAVALPTCSKKSIQSASDRLE